MEKWIVFGIVAGLVIFVIRALRKSSEKVARRSGRTGSLTTSCAALVGQGFLPGSDDVNSLRYNGYINAKHITCMKGPFSLNQDIAINRYLINARKEGWPDPVWSEEITRNGRVMWLISSVR